MSTTTEGAAAAAPPVVCEDCGTELTNKRSRARGRGRICQQRFEQAPTLPTLETIKIRDGLL